MRPARGAHVLLLPEDAEGIDHPTYAIITRTGGRETTVVCLPGQDRQWRISTSTATQRLIASQHATGRRPGEWLRRPVAARLATVWVHGQVIEMVGDKVKVQHGDSTGECSTADLVQVDPIVALLLGNVQLPRARRITQLRRLHAQILDKLLGDADTRPTRDVAALLDGIVETSELPDPTADCTWIEEATGIRRRFPLQHAIDFVYATEGTVQQIPAAVRDAIGRSFCCPPEPTAEEAAAAPAEETEIHSQIESFFADDSASPPAAAETRSDMSRPAADDAHARIVRALATQPELLAEYLEQIGGRATKRRRTDDEASPALDRSNKFTFQPTAHQRTLHRLLSNDRVAGTFPMTFVDSLISHAAVQFAPPPGVLMRLFDFQFGTRGLSVMHLAFMNRVTKMDWIRTRGPNMQNFSHSVILPPPATPRYPEDIVAAIGSLCTYCSSFAPPEVVELVQGLHRFILEEATSGAWVTEDLPQLVYWTDGILEKFRSAAVDDLAGDMSRFAILQTISRANPDFQAMLQLLTQQKLGKLLQSPAQTRLPMTEGVYPGHHDKARVVERAPRSRPPQSQPMPRTNGRASGFPRYVPRRGDQELCLLSLSRRGCPGIPGAPSQCVNPERAHFVPAALAPDIRDFIERRCGGLAPAFHGL